MARNLYRSYLYVILLLLLALAIYALAGLLDPLWRLTPLRPGYEAVPGRAEVVQTLVFAVTVLLFVVALGGLHYWLLRRDLSQDPAAGSGAVHAFFLNLSELVLAPIAIFSLGQVLTQFQSGYAATGLATLAGLLVLEWERRRLPVGPGLARFFQRLHVYGVQLILLFPLVSACNYVLSLALDSYLLGGGHVAPSAVVNGHADLRGPLATALWLVLAWFVYGYFNRHDPGSWLRRLFYGGVLAYGLFLTLDECAALLDLLLRFLAGEKIQATALLSPPGTLLLSLPSGMVLVGLLVAGFAWLWLQSEVKQLSDPPRARVVLRYSLLAGAAALLALLFWTGSGRLLLALLFTLFPTGPLPQLGDWIDGVAPLLLGLGTLPLNLLLMRRYREEPERALLPCQGFILAALIGGVLATTVGGAVLLFSLGTLALGSPVENWPRLTQESVVGLLVGLIVLAFYLWQARRSGVLANLSSSLPAPGPSARSGAGPEATPSTTAATAAEAVGEGTPALEDILRRVQDRQISLEEAASQIRALFGQRA
ncbi:hypothetical protein [Thermogemmatispora tikiterensis]|uniref:DUF5671 domain-containing protein n=1 Tax=Thermogemmatispora tikiterensis TaxID=1825093 RepID=A0A328VSY1_9CHLR|nr:hypothetical protein [Thermogemmatispora tikiterensis]RAQ97215.1 hypothetical protein A4R35_16875 [Thermogemmatispora tikiterensis]